MKKVSLVFFALAIAVSTFAQGLKGIYNATGKSNVAKYEAAMKLKSFDIMEQFALEKIKFDANKSTDIGLNKQIWRFEALLPAQKEKLEQEFPKIGEWYQNRAAEKGKELFMFPPNLTYPPMSFDQLNDIADQKPRSTVLENITYYTIKLHREIFNSDNMVITNYYDQIKNLYASLNKGDRELLDGLGYKNLWEQQLECYRHKQENKTCTCGGKASSEITDFPECSYDKDMSISDKNVEPDKPTEVLIALNKGNLSACSQAQALGLYTWANANKDVVKELIFLQCATLGEIKVVDHVHPNLVELWDQGEKTGSNEYLTKLGFTREMVSSLQSYYSCVLRLDQVAKRKYTKPTDEKKQVQKEPYKNLNGISREIIKLPRKEAYTAYALEDAVTAFLQENIENHEEELAGTCLAAKATSDSTYEVILNRCDSTSQVFAIKEFENPAIAKFFKYCSNLVVGEIEKAAEVVPMTYSILVIGTADVLKYDKNQELADSRAEYIKENLGQRTQTAISIETKGIINLPEGQRFVALTFTLLKTNNAIAKQ